MPNGTNNPVTFGTVLLKKTWAGVPCRVMSAGQKLLRLATGIPQERHVPNRGYTPVDLLVPNTDSSYLKEGSEVLNKPGE